MQTIISQIAFTFVDDATALAAGFGRLLRDMTVDLVTAVRTPLLAPVDRLARACDVGGVIAARDAAIRRSRNQTANWRPAPPRPWRAPQRFPWPA